MKKFLEKKQYKVLAKQRNEGLYLLDWLSWHISLGISHFYITSNDCEDGSDRLLDALSSETKYVTPYHLNRKQLGERSIGEWSLDTMNSILRRNSKSFFICLDLDEYISFQNAKCNSINNIDLDENITYQLPWLNCVPSEIFNFNSIPVYLRNTVGITGINPKFPYGIGFSGKQLKYNKGDLKLENYHSFNKFESQNNKPAKTDLFIKHLVVNSIDEFIIRCERGQATAQKKLALERASYGESVAMRETNNYKYAVDLFLMYISQRLTPKIPTNSFLAEKALKIRTNLLSNPIIKSAQNKIDAYYTKKIQNIKKQYVPCVMRQLNIDHIDKLCSKEIELFNSHFFQYKEHKPHDYYVLTALAHLFEQDFETARIYCAKGLKLYPSVKLLLMLKSCILKSPFITYP